ncbi:MAG TPA: NB-ARC domain-containing protein, partial [Ktedonobacteraceae bacterium]
MKSDLLREERIQHGWSQAQLAEELGVDTRTVRRWERGQAIPFPYYRQKLATLFGKTAEELGLPSNIDEEDAMEEASPLVTQSTSSDAPAPISFLTDPTIPQTLGSAKSLLGRDSLLLHIKERLLAEDHPAFTALHGLPGSGKTALAAALVIDQQVQAHFSDGVLWAGLGQHPNVLGQLARWGRLLGIAPTQVENIKSWETWGKALRAAIGTRRFLLVIDDAWSAEDALAFQIGSPQCCHLLTTSLSQVAFTFAQQEGAILVPRLQDTDGLALLTRFVPQHVEQEPKDARALVQAADGLPLALTLIGNYLTFQSSIGQPLPLQAALAELHDTEQRLRMSMPNIPEDHPSSPAEAMPISLHAAMAISDQLISPQAHATPSRVKSPLQSSYLSEDRAWMISQQPVELLEANLLKGSGPERYSLHQTVDEYAHSQDDVSATQHQVINSLTEEPLQSHQATMHSTEEPLQSHQATMHSFEDHIFSFRSFWDIRIHMGHAPFRSSNRSLWPPLAIISTILLAVVIMVTILPAFYRLPPPKSTPMPENYSPPSYTLTIPTIDPSLQNIAQHLQQTFNAVYPQLVQRFALDPATAPRNVTLTFSFNLSSPAITSGTTITLRPDWIKQHPSDVGLLTDELTLLLEQYPSATPAWFRYGMADYARNVYGPADDDWSLPDGVQPQDNYTQDGAVAARFLLWLEQYTRLDIVDQLNHALQTKQPFSSIFHRLTHHTVDELWSQYKGYPVITLLPDQLYKTVTSRKPIYQSSFRVQNSTSGTYSLAFASGLYLSNFAMQADMTIVHGSGGGFIFRMNNQDNTEERLRVSPDGTYDLVNQAK